MSTIIRLVKHPDLCPNARIIVYADDFAIVASEYNELKVIFIHISSALE